MNKPNPILTILKCIFFVALSAGWLIPLYLGINTYLTWVKSELMPRLAGENPINSFPFIHFSETMFSVSLSWASVAIGTWAVILLAKNSASIKPAAQPPVSLL